MSKYILAIDQGTTGSTVSLIDRNGKAKSKVTEDFKQIYPKPGWVEHKPEDIWVSVMVAMGKAMKRAGAKGTDIAAIGITNQRETVLAWDRKTSKPFYNAIVWQCRRTTDYCESLKKRGYEKPLQQRTGLVVDPYFSGSKFHWLLKYVNGLRRKAIDGKVAMGTVDTFLIWRLSGKLAHVTDVTNASRTQLMNIKTAKWDPELLRLFAVPKKVLPTIVPSSGILAKTKNVAGLPDGIPISGVAGDQQAALFGQIAFEPGASKCTFGTGSFILMNTGQKLIRSKSGLLTTVAWQLAKDSQVTYALEGGAFICGAAVQWLRDELGFFRSSHEVEDMARRVRDSGGVEFVPALAGLGAPYWDPEARGLLTGLTRGTNKAHIARATLDAMALQNVEILLAMQKDCKRPMKALRVDGGASANSLLMQIQADYLGKRILRPRFIETTSAGAAYLAGLGVGFWSDKREIQKVWSLEQEFKPHLSRARRDKRMVSWQQAVAKTIYQGDVSSAQRSKKKLRRAKKKS